MGAVTKEMEKHKTYIRRGCAEIHHDPAIVEHFNRTLAEHLFGHQYAVEMRLPEGQQYTAWVKRLPDVSLALNNEETRLTGKKPTVAIKEKAVFFETVNTLLKACQEKRKNSPRLFPSLLSLPAWRA